LVLAAAAGRARHLRLKTTSLARGAYPQAAKPLSAANGVGRSPLLEQDTLARKRLFLNWQGADDPATLHLQHNARQSATARTSADLHASLQARPMTRQVAFACNIARPKARDTLRSGHPAPTRLPCQPSRFHLPAPHQANPPSAQHSDREQERAETVRQGSLTVTFTARKSPVQATSRARQPFHQPHCHLFSKFIPSAPNGLELSRHAKRGRLQRHVMRKAPG